MALQYPAFVAPQPYDPAPDISGTFLRAYQATRGVIDDMQAGDLIKRLYMEMGGGQQQQPLLSDLARAGDIPPSMRPVVTRPQNVVDGSIDAARGATDLDLAQRLAARYPNGGPGDIPPSQDTRVRVADTSPRGAIIDLMRGGAQPSSVSPQMASYVDAVQQSESGGNPNATNPNSSAAGLYGFTDGTWRDLVANNPNAGLTIDGKLDPRQAQKAMMLLTGSNAAALKAAGYAPTPANLYSAHFLGASGAAKMLGAPDDTPMSALVSPDALQANPGLGDMTAGDFRQWAASKGTRVNPGSANGYQAPRLDANGSMPTPSPQISGADIPPELMAALGSNSVTRPIASALVQARVNNLTADRYQTFKMDDGGLYQMDLRSGQITPIKAGAGATSWRSVTDPAERAKLGISDDDSSLYQVNADNQLRKVSGDVNAGSDDAQSIADAIASGDQPPVLTGLYKLGGPVRANLAKKGYDLTKAQQDWTATQKLLATMNGQGQTRLRQAVNQVSDSLPLIEQLADQWKGGQFPILNKANLALAKNGAYGKEAQSLAVQLDGEIADVAAELATVYRGGNTATDAALEQAGKQFSSDWSLETLKNAIQLAKTNVAYRKNSLSLATAGIADSQYNQMTEQPAPQPAVGPAGVTDATPKGTPAPTLPDPMQLR